MSLDVANCALDHLGVAPLVSLSQKTKTAGLVERNLDKAIRYTLRRGNWSEATASVCPAELDTTGCVLPENFCYAFDLPGDFSRVYDVEVYRNNKRCVSERVQWSIRKINTDGGSCIALLTDKCPVLMEYICEGGIEALPQDVQDLIALNLARRLSVPLKANQSVRRELTEEFEYMLGLALDISSGQDEEELELPDGPITRARQYGIVY